MLLSAWEGRRREEAGRAGRGGVAGEEALTCERRGEFVTWELTKYGWSSWKSTTTVGALRPGGAALILEPALQPLNARFPPSRKPYRRKR